MENNRRQGSLSLLLKRENKNKNKTSQQMRGFLFSQKCYNSLMEYKFHGIILSKNDVGETDRIYTVYSLEAGKVRLAAKGVRKPNARLAGNLEPVSFAEIFVAKNRGQGNITGAVPADGFMEIKKNLAAIEKVFYIFKIFSKLVVDEEKDEKIFQLLLEYLQVMDKTVEESGDELKMDILTFGFIFKLLRFLGYGLEMKKCVKCSAKLFPGKNFFSAQRGGVICEQCSAKEMKRLKISDESVKFIRIFLENRMGSLEKIKSEKNNINNLKLIANDMINWVAG